MARYSFKSDQVKGRLNALAEKYSSRARIALRIEAELIMSRSKNEFVPVDLGTLRSSGHVSSVKQTGKEMTVTLSYGGAASAYALAIHEHPSSSSPRSWRGKRIRFSPAGRGTKYLERPLLQAVRGMAERISAYISNAA